MSHKQKADQRTHWLVSHQHESDKNTEGILLGHKIFLSLPYSCRQGPPPTTCNVCIFSKNKNKIIIENNFSSVIITIQFLVHPNIILEFG